MSKTKIIRTLAVVGVILTGAYVWWHQPKVEWRNVTGADGPSFQAFKGSVAVPENRNDPDSRRINIGYLIVPGTGDTPVFMVAGGPGGSHTARVEQRWVQKLIRMFQPVGDVVMVDLRGIATSTPNFDLSGVDDRWRTVRTQEDWDQLSTDEGRDGRAQLLKAGFDLSGYRVTEAAADLIAVADALGHDRFNLYGTSFGSHYTLTTVRMFPDRINRFMVTGVEGYDHTYDDGAEVRAAVAQIAADAAGVWDGAYGVDDPLVALTNFARDAADDPAHTHGIQAHEVVAGMLYGGIFGFDYNLNNRSGMKTWPRDVARLLNGDRAWRVPFMRRLAALSYGKDPSGAAVGLFDCASHITAERKTRLENTKPAFFPNNPRDMKTLCDGWKTEALPESFQRGEEVAVPGLFLHGTYDVATPYANAVETLEQFPNADLITVERGSHGALWEALAKDPSFAEDIANWFETGEVPPDITLDPVDFEPLD